MKRGIIAIILVFGALATFGQQLLQDGSGSTQISLSKTNSGFLFYNGTDKSATIGYNQVGNDQGGYQYRQWEMDQVLGVSLKVKTTDGIGNFFSKDALNPGFTLTGNFGLFKDNWLHKFHQLSLAVTPQLGYNQYAFIHDQNPDYKLDKTKKIEGSILFNAGAQLNFTPRHGSDTVQVLFVLLQTGFKQMNNYEDLDDAQLTSVKFQSGTNLIESTQTGKLGAYERYNVMPLNIDIAFTPRLFKANYVGFNTYYRTNFFKTVNTSNAGVGIYLANTKKPSQISGGIGWQFNDLYNRLGKDTDLLTRSSAFFYIGFAIGAK